MCVLMCLMLSTTNPVLHTSTWKHTEGVRPWPTSALPHMQKFVHVRFQRDPGLPCCTQAHDAQVCHPSPLVAGSTHSCITHCSSAAHAKHSTTSAANHGFAAAGQQCWCYTLLPRPAMLARHTCLVDPKHHATATLRGACGSDTAGCRHPPNSTRSSPPKGFSLLSATPCPAPACMGPCLPAPAAAPGPRRPAPSPCAAMDRGPCPAPPLRRSGEALHIGSRVWSEAAAAAAASEQPPGTFTGLPPLLTTTATCNPAMAAADQMGAYACQTIKAAWLALHRGPGRYSNMCRRLTAVPGDAAVTIQQACWAGTCSQVHLSPPAPST
jgi:hypothetical protein